jgi:hypothetical protein
MQHAMLCSFSLCDLARRHDFARQGAGTYCSRVPVLDWAQEAAGANGTAIDSHIAAADADVPHTLAPHAGLAWPGGAGMGLVKVPSSKADRRCALACQAPADASTKSELAINSMHGTHAWRLFCCRAVALRPAVCVLLHTLQSW